MKKGNIFWGIFFVLSAVVLVASQFRSFGQIGFWPILAGILLVALFIKSVSRRNIAGMVFPLALLYMVFQKPLELIYINPWMLLAAAALLSIGLYMIFKPRPKAFHHHDGHGNAVYSAENSSDNHPVFKVSFGEASKYLHSCALEGGQFDVSFGSMDVYFDNVQLSETGAEVFIDCNFGAMKLYVPKHWQVFDHTQKMAGALDYGPRFSPAAEAMPQLTLTGSIQFAGVEVIYI